MSHDVPVPVPVELGRRCVRLLSRRICDVPGVVALQVEPAHGRTSAAGDVDAGDGLLLAA